MAIRVAHVGTGNVGRLALTELVTNPQFELTGLCVSSAAKVGKDAGELAGADASTGIVAVNDLDSVLATRPECVVYCAMGDTRLAEATEDCKRILAAGINVVGSAPGLLQYPWSVMPDKYIARIEDAAQQANASIFINGVDPGFINDLVPLALAGTCQRIEQVRCMEIADYATYDGSVVMFEVIGFGKPLDEVPMLLQTGILRSPGAPRSGSWLPAWASNSTRSPSPISANRRPRRLTSRLDTSLKVAWPLCNSRSEA
jgi:hypothetical protein